MTLRDVLNRIRWDPRSDSSVYQITYIHRGDVGDKRTILFSDIQEIHSSWFLYESSDSGEITIPLHRVIEVRNQKSGEIIWRKRGKQS
jgi:uncharacterized protein (UPF0248 family)